MVSNVVIVQGESVALLGSQQDRGNQDAGVSGGWNSQEGRAWERQTLADELRRFSLAALFWALSPGESAHWGAWAYLCDSLVG